MMCGLNCCMLPACFVLEASLLTTLLLCPSLPLVGPTELQASASANANWLVSGWGSTSSGAGKDGTNGALSSKLQYGLMKRFSGDCAKANGLSSSKVTPDMLW